MQVVLLGSAPDHRIQNDFVNLANQLHSSHNDRARLCLAYDEPLSHLVTYGTKKFLISNILSTTSASTTQWGAASDLFNFFCARYMLVLISFLFLQSLSHVDSLNSQQ